jgi:hypothetical protein
MPVANLASGPDQGKRSSDLATDNRREPDTRWVWLGLEIQAIKASN